MLDWTGVLSFLSAMWIDEFSTESRLAMRLDAWLPRGEFPLTDSSDCASNLFRDSPNTSGRPGFN
jgi:hypothetical protein